MLIYLLIFCIVILIIGTWVFIESLKDDDDAGAITFFGALTAASGTAVGFCISLLANS
jgi:hypothetical protein